jgi:adenylate kinase family enzyme
MLISQHYDAIPEWARLDVAIELMAEMLSETRNQMRKAKISKQTSQIKKHKEKFALLMKERQEMYFGNKAMVRKIVVEYGVIVRSVLQEEKRAARLDEISIAEQKSVYDTLKNEMEIYTKPVSNPKIVILGGQPGCGKGGLISLSKDLFSDGNVFILNGDELRKAHPHSRPLLTQHEENYAKITDLLVRDWTSKLFAEAIETKRNIIFEGTMRTDAICHTIRYLMQKDYKVLIQVMAVCKKESILGIHERYEAQKAQFGYGRLTPPSSHQAAYEGMLATIQKIEKHQLFDTLQVYNRQKELRYENNASYMSPYQKVQDAVNQERDRKWSEEKIRNYNRCWDEVVRLMKHRQTTKAEMQKARSYKI